MDENIIKSDINYFLDNVFKKFNTSINPYLDEEVKKLIANYRMQLDNSSNIDNSKSIPFAYNINNIIDTVIDDYNKSHQEINLEEIKSTILRILINIILEYQYVNSQNNRQINFKNFVLNSNKSEDLVKINFLANNQNIIGNLAFVGTSEMLYRDISEYMNLNIYPMYESEYGYIMATKKLLNNNESLLISGNLNEIFKKLGSKYKERYLLNEVIFHMKTTPDKLLKLTQEERELLMNDLDISLPNIDEINQEKEIEKAKEQLNLEKVDYIQKDGTQYIKFYDKDKNLNFAEIVGNITPQERLEKIKNGITTLSHNGIIRADDISKEIKEDMITNGEFNNINDVDMDMLDDETNLGIDTIKKEGYDNMKVDTRTGMIIDNNGNAYDVNLNENGTPKIQKLNENSDKQTNIINSGNLTDIQAIKELEEYGVSKETYLSATEDQKRQIRELYSIGNYPEEKVESKENTNGRQLVKTNSNISGYINSFIITFLIGAFGGMLAMVILNLSK